MNTQPKFSIGQKVWFMLNDEPNCMPICHIDISSFPTEYDLEEEGSENFGNVLEWAEPAIRYSFWDSDNVLKHFQYGSNELSIYWEWESKVFATEAELCKAVFSRVFENAKITQ